MIALVTRLLSMRWNELRFDQNPSSPDGPAKRALPQVGKGAEPFGKPSCVGSANVLSRWNEDAYPERLTRDHV